MIYRVTAKFWDTEAAQRAAHRISGIGGDVYEIRLDYRSDYENNSVLYAQNNRADFPHGGFPRDRFSNPLNSLDEIPYGEEPQDCYMTVFCKDGVNERISQAIINCGGYDISAEEEKLL